MNRQELIGQIRVKKSFLCVGLDTDFSRIPKHLLDFEDPVFEFNKAIIDATAPYCVAYKPNIAFYECLGAPGWRSLEKTIKYIPKSHFIIADAKRGDIGNTSKMYAKAFFENMDCDSITIAPYMGIDSVTPFLKFEDRWVIILGLTSNKGSADFQRIKDEYGNDFYKSVLQKASTWGTIENTMFVVGATHPESFKEIRDIVPDHFLLVPGVGAQGGTLEGVCQYGMNADIGLLVNSSRGIIFASDGEDFAIVAAKKAQDLQMQMQTILEQHRQV